jgi:hypothetical protein
MASAGGTPRGDPREAQRAQALLDYLLETVTIFDSDGTVTYSTGDQAARIRAVVFGLAIGETVPNPIETPRLAHGAVPTRQELLDPLDRRDHLKNFYAHRLRRQGLHELVAYRVGHERLDRCDHHVELAGVLDPADLTAIALSVSPITAELDLL